MNSSSNGPNIFIIDDDQDALMSLVRALKAALPKVYIHAAAEITAALKLIKEVTPEVIVMDLHLNSEAGAESGFAFLQSALKIDRTTRAIVLTGFGSIESGIRCLESGASNFLEKPPDIAHLAALIKDGIAQSQLKRSFNELETSSANNLTSMIIGSSAATKHIRDQIYYAAATNQPVLITGETGTGKGLCALAIHKISKRANKKIVRYQPTFGASDLVSSDLFGHVKGAFTGAESSRAGLIEEANGGTLFLDEIDELPGETQVALLGVLQEKNVRQLGSNNEVSADFRLISATNQNIDESLRQKKLREDFYHRVGHVQIHLTPLRDRREDIRDLALHKLNNLREAESVTVLGISEAVFEKFNTYSWPGNVRELEAVVESAAYRAQFRSSSEIEIVDTSLKGMREQISAANFQERVEDFKVKLIEDALAEHEGNQVKAANALGMERSTLRRILGRKS